MAVISINDVPGNLAWDIQERKLRKPTKYGATHVSIAPTTRAFWDAYNKDRAYWRDRGITVGRSEIDDRWEVLFLKWGDV